MLMGITLFSHLPRVVIPATYTPLSYELHGTANRSTPVFIVPNLFAQALMFAYLVFKLAAPTRNGNSILGASLMSA